VRLAEESFFQIRSKEDQAFGDAEAKLPDGLARPRHWRAMKANDHRTAPEPGA
jgi:hypothetical protein